MLTNELPVLFILLLLLILGLIALCIFRLRRPKKKESESTHCICMSQIPPPSFKLKHKNSPAPLLEARKREKRRTKYTRRPRSVELEAQPLLSTSSSTSPATRKRLYSEASIARREVERIMTPGDTKESPDLSLIKDRDDPEVKEALALMKERSQRASKGSLAMSDPVHRALALSIQGGGDSYIDEESVDVSAIQMPQTSSQVSSSESQRTRIEVQTSAYQDAITKALSSATDPMKMVDELFSLGRNHSNPTLSAAWEGLGPSMEEARRGQMMMVLRSMFLELVNGPAELGAFSRGVTLGQMMKEHSLLAQHTQVMHGLVDSLNASLAASQRREAALIAQNAQLAAQVTEASKNLTEFKAAAEGVKLAMARIDLVDRTPEPPPPPIVIKPALSIASRASQAPQRRYVYSTPPIGDGLYSCRLGGVKIVSGEVAGVFMGGALNTSWAALLKANAKVFQFIACLNLGALEALTIENPECFSFLKSQDNDMKTARLRALQQVCGVAVQQWWFDSALEAPPESPVSSSRID